MKAGEKIDLIKLNKDDYSTPKRPVLLDTKPAAYLTIEGQGAPGGEEFTVRLGALYAMAFTIKMARKFAEGPDYGVCKLEGLWWVDGDIANFSKLPKHTWRWKLLIRTPDFISQNELERAVTVLKKRGKTEPVQEVRLETLNEGKCVQMLHVGPYDQEGATMELMCAFAQSQGYELHGRHHEIYLSDPRRVEPAKLKTILRCPVRAHAN